MQAYKTLSKVFLKNQEPQPSNMRHVLQSVKPATGCLMACAGYAAALWKQERQNPKPNALNQAAGFGLALRHYNSLGPYGQTSAQYGEVLSVEVYPRWGIA